MHLNYIAFAIPLFTGLMATEYYFSVKKGLQDNFRFSEVVANLNVGIVERMTDLFTTGVFYFFFAWLHQHFALFNIEAGWITWVLLFLLTDLVWYWYHRLGHEINLFWSVHVVHHQSDDFNYTVSARITMLQAIARSLFWSILPIIGFPAEMITLLLLVHGTYPFFIHTQLIGKLGWLEYILVTPSHHRVHHASNENYLDKNYGDVLIIWDKLFGTFARENEKPNFGLTKPLNSHSFLWQHFHFLLEIIISLKRARTLKEYVRIIFGKPDDIDPRIRGYLERKLSHNRTDVELSRNCKLYITWQTVGLLFAVFFTILFEKHIQSTTLLLISSFILTSVIATGAMLEQKNWIIPLELFRAFQVGLLLCAMFPNVLLELCILMATAIMVLYYDNFKVAYSRLLLNSCN